MRAIVANIGDELTLGWIVNSNGAYLARQLLELGCEVCKILALPDREEIIGREIERALEEAEVIVLTGGLGPTDDDRTREAIAKAVGRGLVENPEAFENVRQHLARYRKCMDEAQRKQALLPEGARVFPNPYGSAAGFACKLDGKLLIALPGVPREMEAVWGEVKGFVRDEFPHAEAFHTKSIRVALPESVVDQRIRAIKDMVEVTVLAFPGEVLVILRGRESKALYTAWHKALELLGEDVISEDGVPLEEVVGGLLREKKLTLAAAESITGGLVGHRITQVAGSSEYFLGGVEAYSYDVKEKLLGVDRKLLEEKGAVCQEVAQKMAEGVRELVGATVGVATTGIAGPATEMGKPVGLFYVAVAWEGGCEVEEFHSGGSREHIKERAASAALDRVRRVLIKRF